MAQYIISSKKNIIFSTKNCGRSTTWTIFFNLHQQLQSSHCSNKLLPSSSSTTWHHPGETGMNMTYFTGRLIDQADVVSTESAWLADLQTPCKISGQPVIPQLVPTELWLTPMDILPHKVHFYPLKMHFFQLIVHFFPLKLHFFTLKLH